MCILNYHITLIFTTNYWSYITSDSTNTYRHTTRIKYKYITTFISKNYGLFRSKQFAFIYLIFATRLNLFILGQWYYTRLKCIWFLYVAHFEIQSSSITLVYNLLLFFTFKTNSIFKMSVIGVSYVFYLHSYLHQLLHQAHLKLSICSV